MKKFPYKTLLLVISILTSLTLIGAWIYTKNAFDIVKCQTAQVTRFKIDPDYYYHGKEKGMNDAWYRVELSNGASYKVNIQKYDTTYDFQFSEDGFHLSEFLYEPQLRRLFKQNYEEYQKITSFSGIIAREFSKVILEEKVKKDIQEKIGNTEK